MWIIFKPTDYLIFSMATYLSEIDLNRMLKGSFKFLIFIGHYVCALIFIKVFFNECGKFECIHLEIKWNGNFLRITLTFCQKVHRFSNKRFSEWLIIPTIVVVDVVAKWKCCAKIKLFGPCAQPCVIYWFYFIHNSTTPTAKNLSTVS